MGIMNAFNSAMNTITGNGQQQGQQQQGQQTNPGNIPNNPAQTANQNNPTAPVAGTQQVGAGESENKSPLDQFSDIWKNDANAEGQKQEAMFNVDPQKLMESASKVDFSKVVTPELYQRINAGGEDGIKASMEAMNKMNQMSYAQSTLATTKIVEQALTKAREQFKADIPSIIKSHNVSDSLRTDNPALSHPAAQPILSALEARLNVKYPNATVAEIKQMANQYFTSFAESIVPKNSQDSQGGKKGGKSNETDWTEFLTAN